MPLHNIGGSFGRIGVSLALEVKKYINSEHTGEYVDIELPRPALNAEEETEDTAAGERLRLHYIDMGTGEPMILLHTVGQSIYTWRNIMKYLSAGYRVIALDLPGHGYSSRPANFKCAIEDYAEVLNLFMDAVGLQSAHFMCFSMSSAYALCLARQHPEKIGNIILLSPGGITPEMPLMVRMLDNPIFGGVASRLYNLRTVEKILGECFFDLTNLTPDYSAECYKTVSDAESRTIIRNSVYRYDEESIFKELRMLECPVLILWGCEDKWHTSELPELYHAAIKNASYAIVRNAGHLLHEEKADRVAALVNEYIAPVSDLVQ